MEKTKSEINRGKEEILSSDSKTLPSSEEMRIRRQAQPGTLIHKEEPFVFTLSSRLRTENCDHCLHRAKLQKCSGCWYVHYCGRVCQKESWNTIHKYECRNLRGIAPRIMPDAARLLARLILKLRKGVRSGGGGDGELYKSYFNIMDNNITGNTPYRMWKNLMSHYPNIKLDQRRMEHFTSLCGVLLQFFKGENMPNSAEFMGMYGRMCINSFNIMTQDLQCLGTGIYLAGSVFDHSCSPNAVATFEGRTLHVRTLETFQYDNFNQIFISYIDVLNTTNDRQTELESMYYFTCACSRCLTPEPTEMFAAACPNQKCDNSIRETDSECTKCGEAITKEFLHRFREVLELTEMHLQNMKQLAYFDVCYICLQKQQGVLHKLNLKHVKILDLAVQASIDFGKWDYAREYATKLIEPFYKYYGELHPLTGLLHLKLAKILMYQEVIGEAREQVAKAQNILAITHGNESSLFREELRPLLENIKMCS